MIDGKELLTVGTNWKDFHQAYKIEGYPNWDSLAFKDQFDFKDALNFVRGTLRYEGFGVIMRGLHNIGLTSELAIDHSKIKNMLDVALLLCEGFEESKNKEYFDTISDISIMQDLTIRGVVLKLLSKLENFDSKHIWKLVKSWAYFELFNSSKQISPKAWHVFDVLCDVSLEKLQYKEGERDLVIMKHIFTI